MARRAVYTGYSTVGNDKLDTHLYDKALVERDLLNHFYTRLGERPMRAYFGCIIWDIIGDPFDDRTEAIVVNEVKRIVRADPRVTLLDMDVTIDVDGHAIRIAVLLDYKELKVQDFINLAFSSDGYNAPGYQLTGRPAFA